MMRQYAAIGTKYIVQIVHAREHKNNLSSYREAQFAVNYSTI